MVNAVKRSNAVNGQTRSTVNTGADMRMSREACMVRCMHCVAGSHGGHGALSVLLRRERKKKKKGGGLHLKIIGSCLLLLGTYATTTPPPPPAAAIPGH
jgi:hypothetical protein